MLCTSTVVNQRADCVSMFEHRGKFNGRLRLHLESFGDQKWNVDSDNAWKQPKVNEETH